MEKAFQRSDDNVAGATGLWTPRAPPENLVSLECVPAGGKLSTMCMIFAHFYWVQVAHLHPRDLTRWDPDDVGRSRTYRNPPNLFRVETVMFMTWARYGSAACWRNQSGILLEEFHKETEQKQQERAKKRKGVVHNRREELVRALNAVGLQLRADSSLCQLYIERGHRQIAHTNEQAIAYIQVRGGGTFPVFRSANFLSLFFRSECAR